MGKRGLTFIVCIVFIAFGSFVFGYETRGTEANADGSNIMGFYDAQNTLHTQMYANGVRIHALHVGDELYLKRLFVLLPTGGAINIWEGNVHFDGWLGDCLGEDCAYTINWNPTPATLITGLRFEWSHGGGGDNFAYWVSSPIDAKPFERFVETACTDGVDIGAGNDWDGSADAADVDCVDSYPQFSCPTTIVNNMFASVFEKRLKDRPSSDVLPQQGLALDDWDPYGCRRIDGAQKVLFDFNINYMLERTRAGRLFVKAKQDWTVNAKVSYDDGYYLTVWDWTAGSRGGTVSAIGETGVQVKIISVQFKRGWNEIVFYGWNSGGPGYAKLEFTDKTMGDLFDQWQTVYYKNEIDCNDGIDEDSDDMTDMNDPDCGIGTVPPLPPDPSQGICERSPPVDPDDPDAKPGFDGEFLPIGNNPGFSQSAGDFTDSCCGDDPRMNAPGPDDGYCTGPYHDWGCGQYNSRMSECRQDPACFPGPVECWGAADCSSYEDGTACLAAGCSYSRITCISNPDAQCVRYGKDMCVRDVLGLGCAWHLSSFSFGTDYASITANNKYVCLNDSQKNGNEYTYNPTPPGAWHYWSAPVDRYRLHDVLDLTQYISNGDAWYYCDASGSLNLNSGAGERAEYDPLPVPSTPYLLDHINFQYWPDTDCDMVPNSWPDTVNPDRLGQAVVCPDQSDECHTCTPNSEDCFGPMSYCEFIKSHDRVGGVMDNAHRNSAGCRALDVPLPDCGSSTPDGCSAVSWPEQSTKEGWVYPSRIDCKVENTEALCKNHIDDDHDGKTDCADPKCFQGMREQGWVLENCPADMEYQCDDGANNDNDASGADCNDPDCSTALNCVHQDRSSSVAETNAHFVCYEHDGKSNFAECCPIGKPCVNDNFWEATHKNVFGTGVSWLDMLDVNFFDPDTNILSDIIINLKPNSQEVTFPLPTRGADIQYISFMMWFDTQVGLTWKLKYADGYSNSAFSIAPYVMNGNSSLLWHQMVIPASLIESGRTVTGIKFFGSSYISVDNVFFKAKTADYSSPRYCAGTGTWISDLDEDKDACNAQNPQGDLVGGFGGMGWTGTKGCCGDDADGSVAESYADTARGCFNNNVIKEDRVVGDLFRTELSQGGNKDEFKDLLFYNAAFWACRVNVTPNMYASFTDTESGGLLVPAGKYLDLCNVKGSYFCSVAGQWKDGSHESDTFILEDENQYGFDDGTRVRCAGGDIVEVNEVYDWLGKTKNECNAGKCFCPTENMFRSAFYEECDAYNTSNGAIGPNGPGRLDRQSCMESGGYFSDHFCNAGNWTTRTSIVASFLFDYLKSLGGDYSTNYVLTCNLPGSLLYEPYLGDKIGHLADTELESFMDSVCLLAVKDASWKTKKVVLGFALKLDKDPIALQTAFNDAFGTEKGTRLNWNLEWVRQRGDPGTGICAGKGHCINPPFNGKTDNTEVYHFEDADFNKQFMFFATEDLHQDDFPRNGNQTYFGMIQSWWDGLFSAVFGWAEPLVKEDSQFELPVLSKTAKRLYVAQKGDKVISVAVESGYNAGMTEEDVILVHALNMPDVLGLKGELQIRYGSDAIFLKEGNSLKMYAAQTYPEDEIFKYFYQVRLDDIQSPG